MENLRDHTLAWLDSIGADGLLGRYKDWYPKKQIDLAIKIEGSENLVPAFRHADGSYHVEKEVPNPCTIYKMCTHSLKYCDKYQSFLAHKEATK